MTSNTSWDFSNQLAVVTGGGRGIGMAICEQLGQAGAHVVVNYSRSKQPAEVLVEKIKSAGGTAEPLCFDVSSADTVEEAFKELLGRHGKIDILVNNAGIALDSLIARAKSEDWQRTIDVNLSGTFFCCRAVAKSMMKARQGRIVNISSIIGQRGNAGQTAYAASKAAIFGLTKSLAEELASRNVTVNAIAPGYIKTEMTESISESLREEMLKSIPLGRMGEGDDIAQAVSFLCSPAALYVTGQILAVNGGIVHVRAGGLSWPGCGACG